MEKTYHISESLLNEILLVLGNMPFIQVAGIINKIHDEIKPTKNIENESKGKQ